jgi:hypothetical protein
MFGNEHKEFKMCLITLSIVSDVQLGYWMSACSCHLLIKRLSVWASNFLYKLDEPLRFDLSPLDHAPLITGGNYSGVICLNANKL